MGYSFYFYSILPFSTGTKEAGSSAGNTWVFPILFDVHY